MDGCLLFRDVLDSTKIHVGVPDSISQGLGNESVRSRCRCRCLKGTKTSFRRMGTGSRTPLRVPLTCEAECHSSPVLASTSFLDCNLDWLIDRRRNSCKLAEASVAFLALTSRHLKVSFLLDFCLPPRVRGPLDGCTSW
jgi:hypothetical protein